MAKVQKQLNSTAPQEPINQNTRATLLLNDRLTLRLSFCTVPHYRSPGTRSFSSHQLPSHHIQCQRRREPANALAIARKVPLDHFRPAIAGQSVEYQPHRLLWSSSARPGHTRDPYAKSRLAAVAD